MNCNSPTVLVHATIRTTTTTTATTIESDSTTTTTNATTTKTAAAISLQRLSAAAAFHATAMDGPVTVINGAERYTPPSSTAAIVPLRSGAKTAGENGQLIDLVTSFHEQSHPLSELRRTSSHTSFRPMEGVEVKASTSTAASTSSSAMSVAAAATVNGRASLADTAAVAAGDKDERPSLSYKDLIIEAIQSSPEKRLKLSEIYQVIRGLHPYYLRRADQWGWQNSIRHNLSLHDCFIKLPLKQTSASGVVVSGHFWTVVSESEEKRGSPTRHRSRAAGSSNGGGGKHGKIRGAGSHHKNAGRYAPNGYLNGTAGTGNNNGSLATKIKDRQSVSSDSGVMSDESQSTSPSAATAAPAAAAGAFLPDGLLNGLLASGADAGFDQLYQQQHQLSSATRKSSAAAMFAFPAALSAFRSQTSPDVKTAFGSNHLMAQQSPTHQLSPQLRQLIAPNALQLLTSAITPSFSLAQAKTGPLSLTSSDNGLAALLAGGQPTANTNTGGSALAQLFEASCKNQLLAIQQQQQQQQQQSASGATEQLNAFLLPLLGANGGGAGVSPILGRFAALNSALSGGSSSPLMDAGMDSTLGDLLGGTATSQLSELQRLQFLQFCSYQQSVIQQLLDENGAGGMTAGVLLGLGVFPTAATVDQLSSLLSQLQQLQQQQPQQQVTVQSIAAQQTDQQQQSLTSNLLSQLLAKLNSASAVEHHSQRHHPPPSSAPPAPLDATLVAGNSDFGDAALSAAVSDGGGDVSSSYSPFGGTRPMTASAPGSAAPQPSQQQLIDLLLMNQRQQQFNRTLKREISADEPMNFETTAAKTPLTALDPKLGTTPAFQSIGELPAQQQQQQLMTSLIEQYILQNASRLPAQPVISVTDAGESVVSTTTATVVAGHSPPHSPLGDSNFTADFIAAAISAAAASSSTGATTTTVPIPTASGPSL